MNNVYLIWEDVDDWPEAGGGTYLEDIFANKEDADKECEKLNKNRHSKTVSYYVQKANVK